MEIQQHHLPRPSLSHHDILVRCDCLNYAFRADFANRRSRAGAGSRFPKYVRKPNPDGTFTFHLNDDTPMVCKHVMIYVDWLLQNGFVVE